MLTFQPTSSLLCVNSPCPFSCSVNWFNPSVYQLKFYLQLIALRSDLLSSVNYIFRCAHLTRGSVIIPHITVQLMKNISGPEETDSTKSETKQWSEALWVFPLGFTIINVEMKGPQATTKVQESPLNQKCQQCCWQSFPSHGVYRYNNRSERLMLNTMLWASEI